MGPLDEHGPGRHHRLLVMQWFFWPAVAAVCVAGCSKKTEPAPAPDPAAHRASVADLLQPAADTRVAPPPTPSNNPPGGNEAATADSAPKGDNSLPPDMARYGRDLAHVMMLAQKQALTSGHFPKSWDEMIAAKLITRPPIGKNGKPMTWKEFVQAMDQ